MKKRSLFHQIQLWWLLGRYQKAYANEPEEGRSHCLPRSPWEAAALRGQLAGPGEDGGAGAGELGRVRWAAAARPAWSLGRPGERGAAGPEGSARLRPAPAAEGNAARRRRARWARGGARGGRGRAWGGGPRALGTRPGRGRGLGWVRRLARSPGRTEGGARRAAAGVGGRGPRVTGGWAGSGRARVRRPARRWGSGVGSEGLGRVRAQGATWEAEIVGDGGFGGESYRLAGACGRGLGVPVGT